MLGEHFQVYLLAFGFKGTQIPSQTVLAESGEPCKLFERRSED